MSRGRNIGPRGEPGPPGVLPSIDQVMPWLHLVFDAWEDYKKHKVEQAQLLAEVEEENGKKDKKKKKKKKKKHKKDG
jgi:hypothetical protein